MKGNHNIIETTNPETGIVIIFNLKGNHNNGTGKIVAGRIVIIFNLKGNHNTVLIPFASNKL